MSLQFLIAAHNTQDVLARLVMTFHRSAVAIESIRMPLRREGRELNITITVGEKHPNAHRMPAILEKLVDVLSVETILRGPKRGLM
jgi:acetolactate synthase small subunit